MVSLVVSVIGNLGALSPAAFHAPPRPGVHKSLCSIEIVTSRHASQVFHKIRQFPSRGRPFMVDIFVGSIVVDVCRGEL